MSDGSAPNMMRAATWYATRGFPVLPCKPRGKEPLTLHGFKDAATDKEQIAAWWRQWPDANIGIPTGAASGLLVLDIDPRNGGDVSLSALIEENGALPETAQQITGGGGRHIVGRYVAGVHSGVLAPGIDTKGDGGYIIAAPSLHPCGRRYRWDGVAGPKSLLNVAEFPEWLIEKLTRRDQQPPKTANVIPNAIPEGKRHPACVSLAGSMRRHGCNANEIEAALTELSKRFQKPLPSQRLHDISEDICSRYAPGESGGKLAELAEIPEEWPDPVPFLTRFVPEFPPNLLPGFLGDMVEATAKATETPVALPALLGLSVVSASAAKKVVVCPESGYVEPVNLYIAVGMESGNRKTAVLNHMT